MEGLTVYRSASLVLITKQVGIRPGYEIILFKWFLPIGFQDIDRCARSLDFQH